ncbi:unnamed protein product [Heterobilharzia americana]|nr:unnamed protein product [Heterobilharzia americana]
MISMLPVSSNGGDYPRVPPICNTTKLVTPQTNSTGTNTVSQSKTPSRRGRRSSIPPEIREQTRRLKKQNMERKRRARISDKMNALHNLAMNLIGVDPVESYKVEKADILNLCYSVFERVANIAKDKPELQVRLKKLRHSLNEATSSSSITSNTTGIPSSSFSSPSTSKVKMNELTKSIEKTTHNSMFLNMKYPGQHLNLTTTTCPSNTPPVSSISFNVPPCTNPQQTFDEADKENKIPKLIIRHSLSSNKKYATTNVTATNTVTSNTFDSLSINSAVKCSAPFSLCSTPVHSLPSSSEIHSQNNSGTAIQCRSTPLQCTKTLNSSVDNSDSGFHSIADSHNNDNYSLELTPDRINQSRDIGGNANRCCGESLFLHLSNSINSSDDSPINSTQRLSSSSLSSSREHKSAFHIPAFTLTRPSNASFLSGHLHRRQHYQHSANSIDSAATLLSQSDAVTSRTSTTPSAVQLWRPYLD